MIEIKNSENPDGTISFNVSDKSCLILKINYDEQTAKVVSITAGDDDVYDGLVKTALMYASRRGAILDKTGLKFKEPSCGSKCENCDKNCSENNILCNNRKKPALKTVTLDVNGEEYLVTIEE